MFTGIIESVGAVAEVRTSPAGARLVIEAARAAQDAAVGDSIAVNGVCLTAVEVAPPQLRFDVVHETLRRSNLGELAAGDEVNLERPLAAGGRLSGHFVQGHVDATGQVRSLVEEGDSLRIGISAPASVLRYVVEKGSIAVDGISLTVAARDESGFEVAVIPHTRAITTLGRKLPGQTVNLEVDILAKYVEQLAAGSRIRPQEGAR
jgi:riboflavin synthase